MNMHVARHDGSDGAGPSRLSVCVAIPVKDEEERIAACLKALARADNFARRHVDVLSVILLLNNCTDRTRDVVTALAPRLPFPVTLVEVRLPPGRANAGVARRLAADQAALLLKQVSTRGAILITDADSRVRRDWFSAHARAFAQGADAVAGAVSIDPADFARWPEELRRRERAEAGYGALLSRIGHLIDPDPVDPWPRHDEASGASLGVTLRAYESSGGIPQIPSGEDRAFVARLKERGLRVRHCPDVCVVTAGRFFGRAEGGAADTISRRASDGGAPCDARMESVADAVRRYRLRKRLRHSNERLEAGRGGTTCFSSVWQAIEDAHPRLMKTPISPAQLTGEIRRARALLRSLLASRPTPDVQTVANGLSGFHLTREGRNQLAEHDRGGIAAQRIIGCASIMHHHEIAPAIKTA